MQKPKILLAAVLTALALPTAAQAQTQTLTDHYTYDFEPDDLVGETLTTPPPLIKVRPHLPRITLIRPRASFVAEMLQSVEVL